jgi:hypothetical protein
LKLGGKSLVLVDEGGEAALGDQRGALLCEGQDFRIVEVERSCIRGGGDDFCEQGGLPDASLTSSRALG